MIKPPDPTPILDEEVFALTDKGNKELRGASTRLSREQLELLVLIDGRAGVAQVTQRIPGLKREAVLTALRKLLEDKLIGPAERAAPGDPNQFDFLTLSPGPSPSAGAMAAARQEALAGEAELKRLGYYVRIARAATAERKLKEGERLSAVVIEDEPYLGKLLRQYLLFEGIDAVIAANRAEIVAAFRNPRRPDVVLLDVVLPDADGFDVLVKMRQHPALKNVPVIMLTAKASRESVLRGLAGGADGYITKPFEVDVLVKAVRTVLGLPG